MKLPFILLPMIFILSTAIANILPPSYKSLIDRHFANPIPSNISKTSKEKKIFDEGTRNGMRIFVDRSKNSYQFLAKNANTWIHVGSDKSGQPISAISKTENGQLSFISICSKKLKKCESYDRKFCEKTFRNFRGREFMEKNVAPQFIGPFAELFNRNLQDLRQAEENAQATFTSIGLKQSYFTKKSALLDQASRFPYDQAELKRTGNLCKRYFPQTATHSENSRQRPRFDQ